MNFKIKHIADHGEITHNPVNFNVYKYSENEDKFSNDFERLLLRSFEDDFYMDKKITPQTGFYITFAGGKLKSNDAFRNTDLYKKYKALSAFKTLQGEENNAHRINSVIDFDTIRGAKQITVNQNKTKMDLSDILYEKYLKPHKGAKDVRHGREYSNIENSIFFYDSGEIEEIYNEHGEKQKNIGFDIIKTDKGNEVRLFIKDIPENGELIIPSSVYDNDGKEYRVVKIDKYSNVTFKELKTLKYVGDFENLEICANFFHDAKKLQTVEINGEIRNLTIGIHAFISCSALNRFTISGKVENLNIQKQTFNANKTLTLVISCNVENLDLSLRISNNMELHLPKELEDKIRKEPKPLYKIVRLDHNNII